jgi:hypothetical protein
MKGQSIGINDIGPVAISLGVAIISIAVIALVISMMRPASYTTVNVGNYTFAYPTNVTTLPATNCIMSNDNGCVLLSIAVYNATTQASTSLQDVNYYIYYSNNLSLQLNQTSLMNAPLKSVAYTFTGGTNATSVLTSGGTALTIFADWFQILVIVIIAVIILALIMLIGRQRGQA